MNINLDTEKLESDKAMLSHEMWVLINDFRNKYPYLKVSVKSIKHKDSGIDNDVILKIKTKIIKL